MNVGDILFNALRTIVADRVHPDTFPQEPAVPTWPAIRYTGAGGSVYPTICGDSEPGEDDQRVQIDIVSKTATEREALTDQVRAAMKLVLPPAILQGPPDTTFDAETKTFRCTIDYIFYGSSV